MADRQAFVSAYTKVLTRAWSDSSYQQELESNPKEALSEAGLNTGDASVQVVSSTQGGGDLDQQVELYEKGLAGGDITLYVPSSPQLDASELSSSQLEAASKGELADDVTVCCCCCPCCTCT